MLTNLDSKLYDGSEIIRIGKPGEEKPFTKFFTILKDQRDAVHVLSGTPVGMSDEQREWLNGRRKGITIV